MAMMDVQSLPLSTAISVGGPAVAIGGISFLFLKAYLNRQNQRSSLLPPVPEVPGLPVIGNLLQLTEKKPHMTFARWAETYGPIYSIKTGANRMVVLNSNAVAKEAMVTRYSSISSRKLSNALKILTSDKTMVAMSDYDEFYKTAKRHLLTSALGSNAQKRHRVHRDTLVENVYEHLLTLTMKDPSKAVILRETFQPELFALSMKQSLGENVDSIYVEELGTTFSKKELLRVLVLDLMEGAIDVDWRDFFPYLKWIPNKSFETRIQRVASRREAAMRSLIKEQKKRFESGKELNCYLDYLLKEAKTFTDMQILMLVWETIIETSDTTLVSTEWAMYEIAKNPEKQERLYQDILKVCGENRVTEENLCQLPYLSAVFHETLRRHSPVPVVPLRYVEEDTEIGGYRVPAGSEIAINIYACNMDKNQWENPEDWKPERFLDSKYDQLDLHKTMAFGGGKRVCAGSLQAMLISCLTIARLVQEFKWELADGEKDNVDIVGLTNQKLHPLRAMIKRRN